MEEKNEQLSTLQDRLHDISLELRANMKRLVRTEAMQRLEE